jgi:hypothetical protein
MNSDDFCFSCLFLELQQDFKYILVNKEGFIQGMTQNMAEFL